jgi:hypothetical protein
MKPNSGWLFILLFVPFFIGAQKTIVKGRVTDGLTKEGLPFVKVQFLDSKIGTITDSLGNYRLETFYATDTLQFSFSGFLTQRKKIKKDQEQTIDVTMQVLTNDLEEVVIKAPDELPSTRLHKKLVANKAANNKEKLDSYEYELYNKIQFDLSNIGEQFAEKNPLTKRLEVVLNYLDTNAAGEGYLPVLLSESVSDYYFKSKPNVRKEVVKATRITGIDRLQMNQFLGDMYLDLNVYDNVYDLFYKSFVSPTAPYARNYYRFYIDDSTFIGQNWCYKLRFTPKRTGDLTFEGHIWIHDTTYAIKSISASISPGANLNYIQDFYFEQEFEQVEKEVWMMTKERLIADVKLTENSKLYGFYARKTSSRRNFKINEERPSEFYKSDNTVEILDGAKNRTDDEWAVFRHEKLNKQETQIGQMIDSLNETPFFKRMKGFVYFLSTGYWWYKKIEIGSAYSLVAFNPVEQFRVGLALRTSTDFSKRFEMGGRMAYGFGDETFKYGALVRYNISPKKRGMLSTYYSYDIEQIGVSPFAISMGNTFTTVLSTAPFDKLTFVRKAGISLEKDIKKDFIAYTAFDWKKFTPLGLANYQRVEGLDTLSIENIRTSEITLRLRWAKNEEFVSGYFDRSAIPCKNPILSFQMILGVPGILGSEYSYQRFEFQYEHFRQLGVLGRIYYGFSLGYINGNAPYPLLKVHEGNQSLWLMSSAFNKLNFIEFVSDKYVGAFVENKWEGLFFDRIPLVNKLKLRLVTNVKMTYGSRSDRHQNIMLIPGFVRSFNGIPYIESSVGIENILKVIRVDLVWRMTHLDPGMHPLGVRARFSFNL